MVLFFQPVLGNPLSGRTTRIGIYKTLNSVSPFLIKGEEWIQRWFIGESALPCHGLREVAQISDNCIVIFYDVIPLILTCIIAKYRSSFIINNEFQGKISL